MVKNRINEKKIGCLLIHGFTGTPWVFDELKSVLEDHNIEVSAPLLPGHGSSLEDLSTKKWEEWVECAETEYRLLKNSCSRVVIAGLSIGGGVAILLSSRYASCDGLITMSTPLRLHGARLLFIPYIKPFKSVWKKRHITNENQEFPGEAGYNAYPLAGVQQCQKLLRTVRSSLNKVTCPALILHARGDRRIPEQNSGLIFKQIASKQKRVILYPYACHTITKGMDAVQIENDIMEFVKVGIKE